MPENPWNSVSHKKRLKPTVHPCISIDIPFFDAWQSGLAIVCGTKWPIHLLYWSAGQKHTLKDGQLIVIIFLEALVAGTGVVYNKV